MHQLVLDFIHITLFISSAPTQMHVLAVQHKHAHNKTSSLFQKAMNLEKTKTWQGKGKLRTPILHCAVKAQDYDVTLVNGSSVCYWHT